MSATRRIGARPRIAGLASASIGLWAIFLVVAPQVATAQPGLQVRLFKLQYQSADEVERAIKPLGSGKEGTKIDETSAFESISVRDYPQNVAAIAAAIKLLDVPSPDIELHIHVLIAAREGSGKVPAELESVVSQLKQSLKYQAYYEVAGVSQRVKAGAWTRNRGKARIDPEVSGGTETSTTEYEYKLKASLEPGKKPRTVVIRSLDFDADNKAMGNVDINTDFTVREGETVVVGTAAVDKERALILLVSAQVR